MEPDEALHLLQQGTAQIISESELRAKLALGRPLRIKLGADPTSPDLHLGHSILLRKLRQFQDLGHQAVLIIGDFTAMIGDPSGRSATRPQLTREQVHANAQSYREQAFKILDEGRTTVVNNADWLGKMGFEEVIGLNSQVTLQQMLQREDFRQRLDQQQPIHAHEIQYPIMQGWDSVMVQSDVELGGTDQLFNNLVGRDLQKHRGVSPQVVMLLPILEGLDGARKMSKSFRNYIGLTEPPADMFGKMMSISDELMARYYTLLLGRALPADAHPLEAKKQLGFEIVATYHSGADAKKALEEWTARFSEKRLANADLPEVYLEAGDAVSLVAAAYAQAFALTKSRGEARRLIEQGSVQLDGAKITDPQSAVSLQPGQVLRLDKTRAVRMR
ncbi:MAG: tyrosine--tRNA ligase [Verrucomicrobiota bacterium]|jgi:tyrosyl-tRNA synthetase|nr:tyrosine--tRNA ligase [Chthoniobacterales bacterium]MBA3762305.1 tyrosine--tRNA ligase [Chthoniobacterales bacterium]MDQ3314145.1 tyrosine--tRNA ligase [Verrucomicrobiota bacterium]